MKNLIIIFASILISCGSLAGFLANAKAAILVAHYGSSDDDTRAKTIDRISSDIRQVFSLFEVREAYISPVVRRNLAKKGIETDSPTESLLKLRAEGYDSAYILSTTIIDGAEMAEVRKSVTDVSPFFDFIKVGDSLLHSPDDCARLAGILSDYSPNPDEAVIYVGHGNALPSTATYTQLDYMFANQGYPRLHVSTIEGYPDADATLRELKSDPNITKVTLIPMLLVCGNHTKGDIAVDFAGAMKSAGYEVEIVMRGLAELQAVRDMYVDKARNLIGSPAD